MHTVLTIVAVLASALAVIYAFACARERVECEKYANALREARAIITGLEGAFVSVNGQLQKLRGQFFAFKAEVEQTALPLADATVQGLQETAARHENLLQCENWRTAQVEGPKSPAAACDCVYCETMRQARSAFRAAVVPKTAQAQSKLAKVNGSKA